MAWQEPVTDWNENDYFTHSDWNRVCENINYLYSDAGISTSSGKNDFLTFSMMETAKNHITTICEMLGITSDVHDLRADAATMNAIESTLQRAKERYDILFAQRAANVYCGDDLYADENYVRGM